MPPTHLFPPPVTALPVAGTNALFPVRRIFCIGQNYAAHAAEMNGAPDRDDPILFQKPADAAIPDRQTIPYPRLTQDLHHEVELVAAIGRGGADIDPAVALDHVLAYAAGLDLTRRDLQARAKKSGRPWDWAKGFDRSAPVGLLRRTTEIGHPTGGRITLTVDGEERQHGDLADMITDTAHLIALISRGMALAPGDLIFTGTPAGVGPLARGQTAMGEVEGVGTVTVTLAG